MEAWGASTDLFSAGAAAEVDNPQLLKEMAERPGEVVRRARGSAAEHVRALGEGKGRKKTKTGREGGDVSVTDPFSARQSRASLSRKGRGAKAPRPSRAAVERAETTVARAEAARERELTAIAREEKALAKRRRAAEARGDKAIAAAERKRNAALEEYRAKLAAWDG